MAILGGHGNAGDDFIMEHPLTALSATALAALYAKGALSPVEATRAVLDRIAACEDRINAMALVLADEAMEAAKASEARYRAGRPLGALDGVPITIKDIVGSAGHASPCGTAAADLSARETVDSPPVARVKEAGCVIVGKTTMPDVGMLSSGVSSLYGTTRNPWNLARNPGGSSSGAGAALAAGYGPLALGTDIGGSVRLPAAACGVFGHKPSLGRVPIHPPYWGRVTGPMTRTVTDSMLLMAVLTRPDPRDFMSLPPAHDDYAGAGPVPIQGLRIGLVRDIGVGLEPTEEVLATLDGAARALEAAGAIVEPVEPFLTRDMADGLDLLFRARTLNELEKIPPEAVARMLPFIVTWARGAEGRSAVEMAEALNQLMAVREAAVRATEPFDFLLLPTSPIPAYEAEAPCPGSDPGRPFEHLNYTAAFNQSEQPAASLSWGYTADGLPLGIQIVGHRFDDIGVLRLMLALEEMRPEQRPWPALSGGLSTS